MWEAHDDVLHLQGGREGGEIPLWSRLGLAQLLTCARNEPCGRAAGGRPPGSTTDVVRTYDVVEEDDRPWIVMELLATRSLAEPRTAGPHHRVADRVANPVPQAAHAQGAAIPRRQAENVLITETHSSVLTDFGIATTAVTERPPPPASRPGSPWDMYAERARAGRNRLQLRVLKE